MPVGDRRLLNRAPGLGRPQASCRRAGKADLGRLSEAERRIHVPERLRRHLERNLRRADVGRLGDDFSHRQKPVVVRVADRAVVDGELSRRRLNGRRRIDKAEVDRLRNGKGLHGRARLELIGEDAVSHLLEEHGRAVVRVVGRHIRKRNHLARIHVRNHHGARERPGLLNLGAQRLIGEELHARIDRERNVAPGHRFLLPDVVDDAAARIANHAPRAGAPGKLAVARELNAFLPAVVAPGKAHHMRRHGAVGIFAQHLGLDADPGETKLSHGFGGAHVAVALNRHEARVLGFELSAHIGGIEPEHVGELPDVFL